jgi:hypothetical protein
MVAPDAVGCKDITGGDTGQKEMQSPQPVQIPVSIRMPIPGAMAIA